MAAKNTISQRISLEGADEIKRAFEGLGKAGEDAFKKISAAADRAVPGLGARLDGALAGVKKSVAELNRAGQQVGKSFNEARSAATTFGRELGTVSARIGIAAAAISGAVLAVGKFTQVAAENADRVGKTAQGLGLTTKAYQELAFAAQQSDLSTEDFATGISRLNVVIGDALAGNEQAIKKFQQLGVSLRDANGNARPTEEIFKDLADAIARIPDGAQRAAVGSDFFGKSVARWLPLILEGRRGIEALQQQFERTGLGFTDQEIRNAEAFNDTLSALFTTLAQLRDKIFVQLALPFSQAFEAINNIVLQNSDKILAASQQLANQLIPIFEDVVNALLGNDDAVKAEWIIKLRDNVIAFGDAASDVFFNVVIPAFNAMNAAATAVSGLINGLFGTEISGQALLITAAVVKLTGAFSLLAPAITLIITSGKLLLSVFALLASTPALVIAALVAAAVAIYVFWDDIVAAANDAWTKISEGATLTWEAIVASLDGFRETIVAVFDAIWTAIVEAATLAWQAIIEVAKTGWDGVVLTIKEAANRIYAIWQNLTNGITELWDAAIGFIKDAASSVAGVISNIVSSISDAISAARNLIGFAGGGAVERASGGYVSGPGTGTSDSIPAWLSNGEFVVKASAVRKYGLNFLSALNGMRLPQNAVPRFSTGGLVDGLSAALMPRFADGGLVALAAPSGGGRPVNVTIGNESFAMTAPDDVAEKLVRYASKRRVASAGRKPSWYGA